MRVRRQVSLRSTMPYMLYRGTHMIRPWANRFILHPSAFILRLARRRPLFPPDRSLRRADRSAPKLFISMKAWLTAQVCAGCHWWLAHQCPTATTARHGSLARACPRIRPLSNRLVSPPRRKLPEKPQKKDAKRTHRSGLALSKTRFPGKKRSQTNPPRTPGATPSRSVGVRG
jgi:hypothetical protein